MNENPEQIGRYLDYLFTFGPGLVYVTLFAACFMENVFPPFPGDSFIAAAGALVGAGRLDLYLSFALVLAGGMSSVMLMYGVGRRYGREYFLVKDYKYFSAADILAFERPLARCGGLLLVCSRFVIGLRSAIALGAGIARYPVRRMAVYSLLSYIVFTAALFYLAMVVVDNLQRIADYFRTYNMIVWPIVGLATAALVAWKIQQVRTRSK
ncbi:MAG TPA: VTT domain-containing protein [candidate division Zixibacteria bacterium]|nr:VTT domain-containing protein [candidate division Zixibacteria bacterium]